MVIETSRFGSVEIEEDKLIRFPWGIPGFEDNKQYVLMEHREGPFQWLQSTEDPGVAFVVCPPIAIGVAYNVPNSKTEPIQLEKKEDLVVLTIISFNRDNNGVRFHLRSPLLFNSSVRLAYQWTMDPEEVTKHVTMPPGFAWSPETGEMKPEA